MEYYLVTAQNGRFQYYISTQPNDNYGILAYKDLRVSDAWIKCKSRKLSSFDKSQQRIGEELLTFGAVKINYPEAIYKKVPSSEVFVDLL